MFDLAKSSTRMPRISGESNRGHLACVAASKDVFVFVQEDLLFGWIGFARIRVIRVQKTWGRQGETIPSNKRLSGPSAFSEDAIQRLDQAVRVLAVEGHRRSDLHDVVMRPIGAEQNAFLAHAI